jgi:hypothetical protein
MTWKEIRVANSLKGKRENMKASSGLKEQLMELIDGIIHRPYHLKMNMET